MKELSVFAFEFFTVFTKKKVENSMRNDSGIAFRPLIISRSNKHDKVRRVVVGFKNEFCFSDDVVDFIPRHPFDGSTQFFNIHREAVFTRWLFYNIRGQMDQKC